MHYLPMRRDLLKHFWRKSIFPLNCNYKNRPFKKKDTVLEHIFDYYSIAFHFCEGAGNIGNFLQFFNWL